MSEVNWPADRTPRVLLVDDNDNDVELTKLAFTAVDSTVELRCVGDGEQCMDILRKSRASDLPDLILLDLHMPRMGGLEVLGAMRRDLKLRRIPAIVLTTSDAPEDVAAAYRAGCNSYLRKPFSFNAYIQLIETLTRYWFTIARTPMRGGDVAVQTAARDVTKAAPKA